MDPLDRMRDYLRGIVPQDILDQTIRSVRIEFGGALVYVRVPNRERAAQIRAALRAGKSVRAIADLHGVSYQAVAYYKKSGAA